MQDYIRTILLIVQLLLFVLARILDDLSWYDFGVPNEATTFQAIGVAAMSICFILQIIRKCHIDQWYKLLFYRSQLKFFFSWTLIATIIMFTIKIFECHHDTEGSDNPLALTTGECVVNGALVFLTNLNLSLICNTKAHPLELWTYLAVLFVQIVTNGKLFLLFVNELHEKEKDQSILLVSLIIANQILVMDLIFRAAYEEREREEQKEEKMLHHKIKAQVVASLKTIPSTNNLPITNQKIELFDEEDLSH